MVNEIEKIKEVLANGGHVVGTISAARSVKSKYYSLRNDIYELTSFCPESVSFSDRCYCVLNDVTSWPVKKLCGCGCGLETNNLQSNYLPNHGNRAEKVKQKKISTWEKNLGTTNPSKCEHIMEKKYLTLQKNHNCSSPFMVKKTQQGE